MHLRRVLTSEALTRYLLSRPHRALGGEQRRNPNSIIPLACSIIHLSPLSALSFSSCITDLVSAIRRRPSFHIELTLQLSSLYTITSILARASLGDSTIFRTFTVNGLGLSHPPTLALRSCDLALTRPKRLLSHHSACRSVMPIRS